MKPTRLLLVVAAVAGLLVACHIKHGDKQRSDSTTTGTTAELFKDIELADLDRNAMSLHSEIGRHTITIIDFWASWCAPCLAELPSMVDMYDKYKDSGLGIIGISLDTDYNAWRKVIDDNELGWTHVSDLRGWDSYAAQTYGVRAIPYTMIVDNNMRVVAKGLRGKQLAVFIDNYFSKPH